MQNMLTTPIHQTKGQAMDEKEGRLYIHAYLGSTIVLVRHTLVYINK